MRFTADSSGFSVSGKALRFQDLPQVLQDFKFVFLEQGSRFAPRLVGLLWLPLWFLTGPRGLRWGLRGSD